MIGSFIFADATAALSPYEWLGLAFIGLSPALGFAYWANKMSARVAVCETIAKHAVETSGAAVKAVEKIDERLQMLIRVEERQGAMAERLNNVEAMVQSLKAKIINGKSGD